MREDPPDPVKPDLAPGLWVIEETSGQQAAWGRYLHRTRRGRHRIQMLGLAVLWTNPQTTQVERLWVVWPDIRFRGLRAVRVMTPAERAGALQALNRSAEAKEGRDGQVTER